MQNNSTCLKKTVLELILHGQVKFSYVKVSALVKNDAYVMEHYFMLTMRVKANIVDVSYPQKAFL